MQKLIKSDKLLIILIPIIIILSGCVLGGTHGSLKKYSYPVPKNVLQGSVEKVMYSNANIKTSDTNQKNYVIVLRDGKPDTLRSEDSYGDRSRYISLQIRSSDGFYNYTFQYVGTSKDWEEDKNSSLSIAYAYDSKGKGGSAGNGGLPWYKFSMRKKLFSVFEQELIKNVDHELNVKR